MPLIAKSLPRAIIAALLCGLGLLAPHALLGQSATALADPATMQSDRQRSAQLSPQELARATRLMEQAFALWQSKNFEAAKLGFERGLAIHPGNGPGNFYLGSMLESQGDQDGAYVRYQRAVFFDPDSEEGLKAQVALTKLAPERARRQRAAQQAAQEAAQRARAAAEQGLEGQRV